MKKDKKFLNDLENNLNSISKKKKDAIILKYQNIINEELKNKKRINDIIKNIGSPKDIAQNEIKNLKNNKNSFFSSSKSEDKKKNKKENNKFKSFLNFITKDIKVDITKDISIKKKEKKNNVKAVEEIIENIEEEISDIPEIVSEKPLLESKESRKKRILLKTLGVILIGFLLFIWLWVSVILVASLIALLDGVKLIGINIALFGLELLVLWIVIIVNRAVFKKENNIKLNIIIIIVSVLIIGCGIALTFYKLSKTELVKDVSEKYSMTTKFDTYSLPSDEKLKMYILFNSNYDTQYIINYDETLDNKVKVEVKYYECYYDYYVKKSSNSVYVSLKLDDRDRLSVYINDFKDGKIYDNDELSRYVVKISVNKKDYERLVIEN